jgi:hypothetical protein
MKVLNFPVLTYSYQFVPGVKITSNQSIYAGKQTFCVADTGKGHNFAIL